MAITLQKLLNRMDRFQTAYTVEEQFKVRDLDEALRTIKREYKFPWTLKKTTLKIISNVREYSLPTDYQDFGYLDNTKENTKRANFIWTSLQQFYEDMDSRNKLCELRGGETKILGVKYNNLDHSSLLNNAEDDSDWTASDDASGIVEDTVTFKEGNGSIRFTITNSTGVATIVNTFNATSDSDYKKKYHRKWIYLSSVPTSIELRLRTDASNYLSTTLTTQFDGSAFNANSWNLIAQNLDEATETGTFDSSNIASEEIVINDADTGTYFIDASYLSGWDLLDFWYYSKYLVSSDGVNGTQEYFMDSSESYEALYYLIGDDEFADVVMFEALKITMADKENQPLKDDLNNRSSIAFSSLFRKYPDMTPTIITRYYNLIEDHQYENLNESESSIF
jgi:hypothetical protein